MNGVADVVAFEHTIEVAFARMVDANLKREALCRLADFLQEKLARDFLPRQIPYSQSLEVIMRAVGAVLDRDPLTHRHYISEKARVGVGSLLADLDLRTDE